MPSDDYGHGDRGGGSLHSAATTSVAGFMSAADKTTMATVVSTDGAQTLTNKTLTAPIISAPAFSGTATGSLTNIALTTPVITPEAWVNVSVFSNSWVNFDATNVCRYRKDPDGVVWVQGRVKSGTLGLTAFTLPAGYLPARTEVFADVTNGAFGYVSVATSGAVTPNAGTATDHFFSLSFPAA